MIGGYVFDSGDELDFTKYSYFEISAVTNTTVTYNAVTTGLTAGDVVNLSTDFRYLTFFNSIVSNPDIAVKGVVKIPQYIQDNPTKPISFRTGGEIPDDYCCRE